MLLHCLWNLMLFVITLGMLVAVHECGHFLAARFYKVKVERFSIGFGPVLWKWDDSNGTEYTISIILLGGYVKLLNTQTHLTNCNANNTFNKKNIWQKIVIIFAGSIFNFVFAIFLYVFVYIIGVPVCKPIVHAIVPDSIVARAGMQSGIEIISINNIETADWEAVRFQILNNLNTEQLVISTRSVNDAYFDTYIVRLPKNWFNAFTNIKDPITKLGILPDNVRIAPIISDIEPYSIAERSMLKIGDKILEINDQSIYDWNTFIINFKNCSEKNFKVTVERQHKILHFYMMSEKNNLINSDIMEKTIGFFPKIVITSKQNYIINRYQLHHAVFQACNKTWELIYLTINTLIKLIFGDIKTIYIGGPLSIAKEAGNAAQCGLIYYLMFLAVVSINLGIINLLPFPTLDGGHFFFLILEKISRKPISQKIQSFGYIIGFILLTLIMCFVFFNDVSKLW